MGPTAIDYVLGIVKAYTTRVGEGPFPSELNDDDGQRLGERGHEFGIQLGANAVVVGLMLLCFVKLVQLLELLEFA